MKILKTLTCTIAATAAVAFCASSAKAATVVGTTEDYSKLNVSFSVVTNAPSVTKGSSTNYVETYKTGNTAFNNKSLIALFAAWSTNSLADWQAAGAQLIYDFNSDEVCVADKSGTNILYYADNNSDRYFNFEPTYDSGAYTETYNEKSPYYNYSYNEMYYAYFELYFWDGSDATYIDLYGYGQNNEHYSEDYTATSDKWSETDSIHTTGNGYLDDIYSSITSANFNMSGHGNY